jgi:hypothetical protein
MSIVRVGSTQKFSDNWDGIFGGAGAVKKSVDKKALKRKKDSAKPAKAKKSRKSKPAGKGKKGKA